MTEKLGTRFAYTAGFATRKEFEDAPGKETEMVMMIALFLQEWWRLLTTPL